MTITRLKTTLGAVVVLAVAACGRPRPAPYTVALGPELGESTASPGSDPSKPQPDAGAYDLSVPISPALSHP
ncbi:MAG: hypothetical protein H0T79_06610, partial [Deltaproteobacteria bacterium]|nr:hypothetical protein [Deltaproteobacteria bacterium]